MVQILAFWLLSYWLIGVYHLGHLATGKILGFPVTLFRIGFGPLLVAFTIGKTRFELRILPFGGSVRTPRSEVSPQYALFAASGPLCLLLLSVILGFFHEATLHTELEPGGALVSSFESKCLPGQMQTGDVVLNMDGNPIKDGQDFAEKMAAWVTAQTTLMVERSGRPDSIELQRGGTGKSGVASTSLVFSSLTRTTRQAILKALASAPRCAVRLSVGTVAYLGARQGTVRPGGRSILLGDDGFTSTLIIFSLLLGALNLIPLPPLIGWEILCLATVRISGRRLDAGATRAFEVAGLVLIVLLLLGMNGYIGPGFDNRVAAVRWAGLPVEWAATW